MSTLHAKANANRFEVYKEILVGPPSRLLRLSDVAKDPFFRDAPHPSPALPEERLSQKSKEKVAKRCTDATKRLQDEVRALMQDTSVATNVRKRLLTWVEDGSSHDKDAPHKKRKHVGEESSVEEWSHPERSSALEQSIPGAFTFQSDPRLASAYLDREGRLDDCVISQPTPSRCLKNDGHSLDDEASQPLPVPSRGPVTLLLSISIYARSTRGLWAKERVARTEKMAEDEEIAQFEELLGEFSSEDEDRSTERTNLKESTAQSSREGPYGPLQLVQKLKIRSNSTLQDLRDSFICRMDDFPERRADEQEEQAHYGDGLINFSYTGRKRKTDSCFLIEDILYSEQSDQTVSYAPSLASHFAKQAEKDSAPTSRATASSKSMKQVTIDSIELRTGKLYWCIHQGSCEHLWAITSVELGRPDEPALLEPMTTFLQYGFAIRPLIRWTRPKARIESYGLESCDLCKSRTACLVILGGQRFRSQTGIDGLRESQTSVCEPCWWTLNGQQPPDKSDLSQRAGREDVKGDMSKRMPWGEERVGGHGWTVVPALE